jgi:hypothetical protein
MSDNKTAINLRIPINTKCKIEYLADQTNRSVNGMIIEMIESYSLVGGTNSFKGMTPDEYASYLKHGLECVNVSIFDFEISNNPNSYSHSEWVDIDLATNVADVSGCYALIDNDEILYIGSSKNLHRRMLQRKSSNWIASGNVKRDELDYGMELSANASVMFWFCDEYRDMERDLIYSIDPSFNASMPKHSGKSNLMIITSDFRRILSERLYCGDPSTKEKRSIEKLLSMNARLK